MAASLPRRLFDWLGLQEPIACVDIGAMALESVDVWTTLVAEGCTRVLGFEPIEAECAKLRERAGDGQTFLPLAIGDGGPQRLHVTNTGMTSSLLEPDLDTMGMFHQLAELCQVKQIQPLATVRLDDIDAACSADFLKLDIQGAELSVLQHATHTLAGVSVVQTEVEFVEIYRDQPLFADVDSFLRAQGFSFHKFTYLAGRPYRGSATADKPAFGGSQTLWGDAIYIRDLRQLADVSLLQLRKLAYIVSAFYGSQDLAQRLLAEIDQRQGSSLSQEFPQWLQRESSAAAAAQTGADQKQGATATPLVALPLTDGLQVVVPNQIQLITPYVLVEQGDWFEDERPFLSRLLRPGDIALDIGANYGIYTATLAAAVESQGRVLAFEPSASTADALRQTVAANGQAGWVTVHQLALSDQPGQGVLLLNGHSELNALAMDASSLDPAQSTETVAISSLDQLLHDGAIPTPVNFIKMDAEGQEAAILRGAAQFLAQQQPLIQFEVKAGSALNLDLIEQFRGLGCLILRLVPGLPVLVPLHPGEAIDPYLLNLFACFPAMAANLRHQGLLVEPDPPGESTPAEHADALPEELVSVEQLFLQPMPYCRVLAKLWQQQLRSGDGDRRLWLALHAYSRSQNRTASAQARLQALRTSFTALSDLCRQQPSALRLASLARAALDFGQRAVAVEALAELLRRIQHSESVDVSEPFLLPCPRYDPLAVKPEAIGRFVTAAVLEALNRSASYSSFYSPAASLERLSGIEKLGFASPEITRGIDLIRKRMAASPHPSS
jgi:FkbM family methyltransferase